MAYLTVFYCYGLAFNITVILENASSSLLITLTVNIIGGNDYTFNNLLDKTQTKRVPL